MELKRPEVISGLFAEYEVFTELVRGLSAEQWDTPTRCTKWLVRDVAAHVAANVADAVDGTIGSRTQDEQAAALRHHDPAEMAGALRAAAKGLRVMLEKLDDRVWTRPSVVRDMTVGEGVLTLWYDTFVHGDDIRTALGMPSLRGPGLRAAVEYVRIKLNGVEWGPARIVLSGLPTVGNLSASDANEVASGTGGPVGHADALEFVLAATGRADPAPLDLDNRLNIYP